VRNAILDTSKDGMLESIKGFLKGLLEKELVNAVLVPVELPSGNNVVQTLVSNPEKLDAANPLAPVLPVNSARIISSITRTGSSQRKIAVVLRSCELRAVIELAKLKQVTLDNLLIIGIDCYGTYSINDYSNLAEEGKSPTDNALGNIKDGKEDELLREACQVCEYPAPLMTDLTIGMLGQDLGKELVLIARTEKGEELLEGLGLAAEDKSDAATKRETAVAKLLDKMKGIREKFFEQTKEEIGGADKLAAVFGPCIKCQNCRMACPVCYCRECFFVSPTFELEAEKYLGAAEKKGAMRMPTDTLLFHLTRMTHMAASCIGCGACEEACPNDIPLLKIFQLTGTNVQKLFNYIPGRSLDDELPPTAFKEDELEWIGEK